MAAVKVWISNHSGHDYSNAKQYGEFDWITKGYVSFQSLDRVKFTIAEQVSKTNKDDWLLISGRPIISCIAILVWFICHNQVKILHWDQKTETYRPLIITADNVSEMLRVIGEDKAHEMGG